MDMLDAAAIKAIREALGKTQTEFAALLGVTQHAVISWENGRSHPRWKSMERINELSRTATKRIAVKA